MKTLIVSVFSLLLCWTSLAQSQSQEEYRQRREHFIQKMAINSVAIIKNAPMVMRNDDVEYEYRSNSNFYYLTGWTEPGAVLFLFKKRRFLPWTNEFGQEILFIPKARGGRYALYYGTQPSPQSIKENMMFDAVATNENYKQALEFVFSHYDSIYMDIPQVGLDEPLNPELKLLDDARQRLFTFQILDPQPILTRFRRIKSQAELSNLQKAIDITCQAHREVMRSAVAGMYEYELKAILEYVFQRNGALRDGFPSIVASGANSVLAHYSKSTRQTKPGDMVVLDIGAEYNYYTADVTRTIPISGTFTPQQAEIYQIVLKSQLAAIDIIKPGVSFQNLNNTVRKVLQEAGYGKYLYHGISHPIGLDVHDVGASGNLEPGMVITVEPGLYIPANTSELDSTYWNIGIRIEDDVLVTETGHRVLSTGAPKSIEAIEKLMQETGIGNHKLE